MSASVTVRRGSGRGTTGAWRSPVQGSRSGMHAGLAGAPASESAAGDVRNADGCGPGTVALPGAAIDPRRDDEPRPAGMWPAGAPAVCDGPPAWGPLARRGGVPDPLACGPPRAGAVCQIPMGCRQRTSLTASCHVRGHARHPAGTFHPRPTLESRSSHAAETLGAARQASRNRRGPAYATPGENLAGPPAACRRGRRAGPLAARAACRREPLAGEGSSSPTPDLTSSSRRSRGRRRSCPRGRMPAPAGRPPCPRGSP